MEPSQKKHKAEPRSAATQGYKIYFCGSIRGAAPDKAAYQQIISHLKTHGNVLTEQ